MTYISTQTLGDANNLSSFGLFSLTTFCSFFDMIKFIFKAYLTFWTDHPSLSLGSALQPALPFGLLVLSITIESGYR